MSNSCKYYLVCIFILSIFFSSCRTKQQLAFKDLQHPKREFRGAWIHTLGQGQYKGMNSEQMKQYFVKMLDQFQKAGINAVIFQVRPQADAFYYSELEPWSRYLTGTQGKAPDNNFDPLSFMVDECHKRNMELHAWLNPYRVNSNESQELASSHIYNSYPERFVKYGTQIYFDPGIPANRVFICKVVKDIVKRYDVDAIHMDDYFYPYPIAGESFPDDLSFNTYAKGQGYGVNERDDWRRNNINLLIDEIKQAIVVTKPWVRFGISPFGIYRNKRSTPDGSGSESNGLQNYDDLYADIKLWVQKGWIDYNVPQIYWEIGNKSADYTTLIHWWANNNFAQHMYIGQDITRTMDATMESGNTQLSEKMRLSRSLVNVHGNVFWTGYNIMNNYKGITSEMTTNYHKYPALIPAYTHMHNRLPKQIKDIKEEYTSTHHVLTWQRQGEGPESASYFVVYRFESKQKEAINDARNIVAITRTTAYVLPYEGGNKEYKYVVTAVDAFHNESKGKSIKVKL